MRTNPAEEPPTPDVVYIVCYDCNDHFYDPYVIATMSDDELDAATDHNNQSALESVAEHYFSQLCKNRFEFRMYSTEDMEDGAAYNPDVDKGLND